MPKKYPAQCGPNLGFYYCESVPHGAVVHKGCGGIFIQTLGPPNQNSYDKPENHPGKIFCYECGHKASKAVAAALKLGTNQLFCFPDMSKFELCPSTFADQNGVSRYWEWKLKGAIEGATPRMRGMLGLPRLKPAAQVKPLKLKITVDETDHNWNITRQIPGFAVAISKRDHTDEHVGIILRHLQHASTRNSTSEQLDQSVAALMRTYIFQSMGTNSDPADVDAPDIIEPTTPSDTIDRTDRWILSTPGPSWAAFDKNHWDKSSFEVIRGQIREINFANTKHLLDWLNSHADAMGLNPRSVMVLLGNQLEAAKTLKFLTNATTNPCKELKTLTTMPMSSGDKFIISYTRSNGTHWFLTLNRAHWSNAEAQIIRNLVRSSVFAGLEGFVGEMAAHARKMGKPMGGESLQVSSSLETAENINFPSSEPSNPCEEIKTLTSLVADDDKFIISYTRGDTNWFLTLNRAIWSREGAGNLRNLIRNSVFKTPHGFASRMTAHARTMGQPAHMDSLIVSTNLKTAEDINF